MPLSSAREISGQRTRAATVTAQPIRRIFVSMDAVANLQAVFAVAAMEADREASQVLTSKNELPGWHATLDSKS